MKVGIIGAGRIAAKMATALEYTEGIEKYAIASRDVSRASAFAIQYGMERAYGSYQELLDDPSVDLVYIATPHSHHCAQALGAIEAGKPVLCEKAFTANAREAERVIEAANRRGVFVSEAIMPRFIPLMDELKRVVSSGAIGAPAFLNATLSYSLAWKERVMRPELCGGALLDLGVYLLTFARMVFGTEIVSTTSEAIIQDGVDVHESIVLRYADGRLATLTSSAMAIDSRAALISGSEGYIQVDNANVPSRFEVFRDYQPISTFHKPFSQLDGLRAEVLACRDALAQGLLELPAIPHAETLAVMRQMDDLRSLWGVRYAAD